MQKLNDINNLTKKIIKAYYIGIIIDYKIHYTSAIVCSYNFYI